MQENVRGLQQGLGAQQCDLIKGNKIDYLKVATDSVDIIAAGLLTGPVGAAGDAVTTLATELETQYEAFVQNAGPVSIPDSSVASVEAALLPRIRKLVHGTPSCCNLATNEAIKQETGWKPSARLSRPALNHKMPALGQAYACYCYWEVVWASSAR